MLSELEKLKADAEQGNTQAQYKLGMMYLNGEEKEGITQDLGKAINYFGKCSNAVELQKDLSWAYLNLW
ncbi:hypothetical protein AGMMS49592_3960 [Endomicrobiia bacterium]|nr:hypothetical protein AGMMS49592_3960 [Endomicrobiia bacterium]